ncbi:Polyisoprenoid-binding protein YceI [Actinopolyspora alba]|uniref:Polyisoprenoid-binding protein YceI n=1 Tax=Actinopolyspora alba TaxID=673379 RepID=A0A1I1WBP8_9ACTN|nr:YceI family protein [Actinopolyspora alba]SFD92532.1 Polyisoprenoid-binding protein YceI [Actinopolyspora alba]
MVLSKLLGRGAARKPAREGASNALPPTPLDGGTLSCQVHDEADRPLPEATVTVVNRLNQQVASGTTDGYGFFLATVQPGTHKVSITGGGYQRTGTRAEVRTNRHTAIGSVRLERDPESTLPEPGVWTFDPDHTEIRFIAQHIGMSKIHGAFRELEGRVTVREPFEKSVVEVAIDASSIDTGVRMRDDHLRSADFLDVANHPRLYFRSDRLTQLRGDRWVVGGQLTLRGRSSPVQLDTTYLGTRSWNGTRTACHSTTELRREDYAVNWQQLLSKGIGVVGPTVRIELDVQAVLEE